MSLSFFSSPSLFPAEIMSFVGSKGRPREKRGLLKDEVRPTGPHLQSCTKMRPSFSLFCNAALARLHTPLGQYSASTAAKAVTLAIVSGGFGIVSAGRRRGIKLNVPFSVLLQGGASKVAQNSRKISGC